MTSKIRVRVKFLTSDAGGRKTGPPVGPTYRTPAFVKDECFTCQFTWDAIAGMERDGTAQFIVDGIAESLTLGDVIVVKENFKDVTAIVTVIESAPVVQEKNSSVVS